MTTISAAQVDTINGNKVLLGVITFLYLKRKEFSICIKRNWLF